MFCGIGRRLFNNLVVNSLLAVRPILGLGKKRPICALGPETGAGVVCKNGTRNVVKNGGRTARTGIKKGGGNMISLSLSLS